jgi:methanogenic corrinoid protein MtbC1
MRPLRLLVIALLLVVGQAARAQNVLHINAEMVRQRSETGIHKNGSKAVANWIKAEGATVRALEPVDLSARAKTRLDLAYLGRPDLVTISATMWQSVSTVRHLVRSLTDQGVSRERIVVGGKAMTAARAQKLGVGWADKPDATLRGYLQRARTAPTKSANTR